MSSLGGFARVHCVRLSATKKCFPLIVHIFRGNKCVCKGDLFETGGAQDVARCRHLIKRATGRCSGGFVAKSWVLAMISQGGVFRWSCSISSIIGSSSSTSRSSSSKQQAAGSRQQAACSRRQAGSRQQASGIRHQAAGRQQAAVSNSKGNSSALHNHGQGPDHYFAGWMDGHALSMTRVQLVYQLDVSGMVRFSLI